MKFQIQMIYYSVEKGGAAERNSWDSSIKFRVVSVHIPVYFIYLDTVQWVFFPLSHILIENLVVCNGKIQK